MDDQQFPAPYGLNQNYEHPVSQAKVLVVINAVCIALMLLFVGIRIYTKHYILRSVGWDDYTCIVAALGSVIESALILYTVKHGLGVHLWDIPADQLTVKLMHVLIAIGIVYGPVIFFVKLSMLLLYLRIFAINTAMRYLIYFGIAFQVLFYLAYFAVYLAVEVLCVSIESLWTSFCADNWKFVLVQGTVNVVTDFYVLCLPTAMVMQLQLTVTGKLKLISIFMTGLLACIVSVVRLAFASRDVHNLDLLWVAASTSILSTLEINFGIICGCMTALPMFCRKLRSRSLFFGSLESLFFSSNKGSKMSKSFTPSAASKKIPKIKSFHGLSLQLEYGSHLEFGDLSKLVQLQTIPEQKEEEV